jgi:hypothetical protein
VTVLSEDWVTVLSEDWVTVLSEDWVTVLSEDWVTVLSEDWVTVLSLQLLSVTEQNSCRATSLVPITRSGCYGDEEGRAIPRRRRLLLVWPLFPCGSAHLPVQACCYQQDPHVRCLGTRVGG